MKQGLFLVVLFGAILGGCALSSGALIPKATYQSVDGLISENRHSPKDGMCSTQMAERGVCWREWNQVEAGRGKATRTERYFSYDLNGRKVDRMVLYFDTAKQTEVYVLDEDRLLCDDFVTSVPQFSLKNDRHKYGL